MTTRIIKTIKRIGHRAPKKKAGTKKVVLKKIEKKKILRQAQDKPEKKAVVAKEYLPLERALKKKEKQLNKQLANIANKSKSVKGDYKARFPFFGRGKDEDAQEVTQYEKHISIEHQLESELEKVEAAIKKVEGGKYGICKACKKKIQPERLKIYPEAQHCMECHKKGV